MSMDNGRSNRLNDQISRGNSDGHRMSPHPVIPEINSDRPLRYSRDVRRNILGNVGSGRSRQGGSVRMSRGAFNYVPVSQDEVTVGGYRPQPPNRPAVATADSMPSDGDHDAVELDAASRSRVVNYVGNNDLEPISEESIHGNLSTSSQDQLSLSQPSLSQSSLSELSQEDDRSEGDRDPESVAEELTSARAIARENKNSQLKFDPNLWFDSIYNASMNLHNSLYDLLYANQEISYGRVKIFDLLLTKVNLMSEVGLPDEDYDSLKRIFKRIEGLNFSEVESLNVTSYDLSGSGTKLHIKRGSLPTYSDFPGDEVSRYYLGQIMSLPESDLEDIISRFTNLNASLLNIQQEALSKLVLLNMNRPRSIKNIEIDEVIDMYMSHHFAMSDDFLSVNRRSELFQDYSPEEVESWLKGHSVNILEGYRGLKDRSTNLDVDQGFGSPQIPDAIAGSPSSVASPRKQGRDSGLADSPKSDDLSSPAVPDGSAQQDEQDVDGWITPPPMSSDVASGLKTPSPQSSPPRPPKRSNKLPLQILDEQGVEIPDFMRKVYISPQDQRYVLDEFFDVKVDADENRRRLSLLKDITQGFAKKNSNLDFLNIVFDDNQREFSRYLGFYLPYEMPDDSEFFDKDVVRGTYGEEFSELIIMHKDRIESLKSGGQKVKAIEGEIKKFNSSFSANEVDRVVRNYIKSPPSFSVSPNSDFVRYASKEGGSNVR